MDDIKGYEGIYKIDRQGNVFSLLSNDFIYSVVNKGYRVISLFKDRKQKQYSFARLLATQFIPNPENKPYINHIDGNKLNNELFNLEWCTAKENTIHSWKLGLSKYTPSEKRRLMTSKVCRKFSVVTENEIRNEYLTGNITQWQLAEKYGCSRHLIMRIINNQHKVKAVTL